MKRLKYVFILFCFSLFLSGCGQMQEVEPVLNSSPLLLEVSKDGVDHKLYLFGSIHAADDSLYPLPNYVMDAYRESEVIAVEFDLIAYSQNISKQMEDLLRFADPEGREVQDYLDPDLYDRAVQILSDASFYSKSLFQDYSPIIWSSMLENAVVVSAGLDAEKGIDSYFLKLSKDDGKEILELESSDYQYDVLMGFDYDMQLYLLEQAIYDYEVSKHDLSRLYQLYKKGNQDDLEELLTGNGILPNQYIEEYNEKLITVRNQNMAHALEDAFWNGKNIFCTVGLAHIIGDGGVADLMEQDGFTVRLVK